MIIRLSNLDRSLVNPQAYINWPFQTLSTTLGSHLLGRAARKKNLPLLPELLGHTAQGPGQGQELSTLCNHANDVQIPISTWKLLPCLNLLPCLDLLPCNETTPCPRVRFPQTSLDLHSVLHAKGAVNALQRCTAQPNAHLHGGAGVFYKQKD